MMAELSFIELLFGIILVFLGARLFWLFVAIIGFLTGIEIAPLLFSSSGANALFWALIFGVIGAVFAVLFYNVAIVVAGFLAGGYVLSYFFAPSRFFPVLFIIGGLIGALALIVTFDWALIALTSLIGAELIVRNMSLNSSLKSLFFILIALIGVVVQLTYKK